MPCSGSYNPLTLNLLPGRPELLGGTSLTGCGNILNSLLDEYAATDWNSYKGRFSSARVVPITARALANTASNISSVSLPVLVFCRLG